MMCTVHNLPLDLICQSDSKLLCKDCSLSSDHAGNPTNQPLPDFFTGFKTQLETSLASLDALLTYAQGPSKIAFFQAHLKERIAEFFKNIREYLNEMQRLKLKELDQIFADILMSNNAQSNSSTQMPYVADLEELKIMKIVGEKHLENFSKHLSVKNFTQLAQDHSQRLGAYLSQLETTTK